MPDGSEGKVLAPPTNRSSGWPQSHHLCTSRRSLMLLLGSESGGGDLNLNADINSSPTLVQNCHYIYWQMLMGKQKYNMELTKRNQKYTVHGLVQAVNVL